MQFDFKKQLKANKYILLVFGIVLVFVFVVVKISFSGLETILGGKGCEVCQSFSAAEACLNIEPERDATVVSEEGKDTLPNKRTCTDEEIDTLIKDKSYLNVVKFKDISDSTGFYIDNTSLECIYPVNLRLFNVTGNPEYVVSEYMGDKIFVVFDYPANELALYNIATNELKKIKEFPEGLIFDKASSLIDANGFTFSVYPGSFGCEPETSDSECDALKALWTTRCKSYDAGIWFYDIDNGTFTKLKSIDCE